MPAALAGLLRELLSNPGDHFTGRRPVRLARIAVEDQRTGFQGRFEFFVIEGHCLIVVVRTVDLKIQAFAHKPSRSEAPMRFARSVQSILDSNAEPLVRRRETPFFGTVRLPRDDSFVTKDHAMPSKSLSASGSMRDSRTSTDG